MTSESEEQDNENTEENKLDGLESIDQDREIMFEGIKDLPPYQNKAVKSFVDEIYWLMQDETTAVMLDKSKPNEDTLEYVAKHVANSKNRDSCYVEKVPLHFVFSSNSSLPRFIEELKKLTIDRYTVRQEGNLFYFVKKTMDQQTKIGNKDDDDESIKNEKNSSKYL